MTQSPSQAAVAHAGHEENLKRAVERLQQRCALLEGRLAVLDEENERFAELLRQHGEDVRRKSHIHVELPPALTAPAPANRDEVDSMTPREQRLYANVLSGAAPMLLLLTESLTDVGQWLWKSRVWLAVTDAAVVMFASGRRPLIQQVPFKHVQESLYNHVTGELVLAPDRKFRLGSVRLPPVEGYQVLAQIYSFNPNSHKSEKTHA